MWPRARDSLPLELVETIGAGVMARHDFDSLREKHIGQQGGMDVVEREKGGVIMGGKWSG
jgi:hypothetical protein